MFAHAPAGADAGYAVIARGTAILLGAETPQRVALALHRRLEHGAVELDELLRDVARVLPPGTPAVVASTVDDVVRVAVRGTATARLDRAGETRLGGPEHEGWIATEASGVRRLGMALPGAEGAVALPVGSGVVRTAALELVLDDTETEPEAPEEGVDDATEDTSSAPAAPAVRGWILLLPDGSDLDPAHPIVIGRRSWTARRDPAAYVHVVVPSPLREISGEHLELALVDGVPVARDLGSTNGTLLFSQLLPPVLLRDGASARLGVGDVLDLGEGCVISVADRAAPRSPRSADLAPAG